MLNSLCQLQIVSSYFIDKTRKINIFVAIVIIIIGLMGNSLGFLVFLQKKIRSKSTSVYLLCLIISDSLYLVTHFFEDTLKAYIDHYVHKTEYIHEECLFFHNNLTDSFNDDMNFSNAFAKEYKLDQSIAGFINIMDRYDFFCRSINFARYFLRFMSAYIIVAFTIQRTQAIRKPFLQKNLESKKKALFILLSLVFLATLSSIWIPILLHSTYFQSYTNLPECYIRDGFSDIYFGLTNSYIVIIMLIPMLIICVCNTITIYLLQKSNKKRQSLTSLNFNLLNTNFLVVNTTIKTRRSEFFNMSLEPFNRSTNDINNEINQINKIESDKNYLTLRNSLNKVKYQEKKTNVMLLVMSFSYVVLDLPYFISWIYLFYYGKYHEIKEEDVEALIRYSINKNYLIGIINLTELLYLLNFSIHFYIYCISSETFCKRLRQIFKWNNNN